MLLACPQCLEQLQFNGTPSSIKSDTWFRCPYCSELFRPPQQIWDINPECLAQRHTTLANRAPFLGHKPIKYQEAPTSVLDHIPMSLRPTWVHRHTFGIIIGLFLVVAFLLGWAFNSSQVQVPVTAPVVERPAVVRSEYGQKRVIEDMLFLKRKLQLTGKSNYSISYRGAEYRLVKHFLNQLAPDVCPAFSSIDIWSMRTREGFQATSLCGQKQTPVTLVVKWTPEIADISLAGDDGGISLDLTI